MVHSVGVDAFRDINNSKIVLSEYSLGCVAHQPPVEALRGEEVLTTPSSTVEAGWKEGSTGDHAMTRMVGGKICDLTIERSEIRPWSRGGG